MPAVRHLVTGGAGFIGSHLTRTLRDRGQPVLVVDNLSGGWADNVEGLVVTVDLATEDLTEVFEFWEPTHVWHLAAYAAEGLSHWVREFNYLNNTVASAKLITAAVKYGVERFYFTSSMAVYGSQVPPFTEIMRPAPEDPYGIAKYGVEQDLAVANRMHGLRSVIFRPHNVYGPGQNIGDPYRNVVGIFMRQALLGLPLTIFGDGRQVRAFSHISDIVAPMVRALDVDPVGHTFNIGGEQPVTILELAEAVAELTGATIKHLPPRVEVGKAWCDHTQARNLLEFEPATPFDVGLKGMWEWVQEKGVRWSQTPILEHDQNLPEFWRGREAPSVLVSGSSQTVDEHCGDGCCQVGGDFTEGDSCTH